jgi:hypothetical protein
MNARCPIINGADTAKAGGQMRQTSGGDHRGIESQVGGTCGSQRKQATWDAVSNVFKYITAAKVEWRHLW